MGLLERLGLRRKQEVFIVVRGQNRSLMGVAFSEVKAQFVKANAELGKDKRTKCHIERFERDECY